jgi:hypothetical protein
MLELTPKQAGSIRPGADRFVEAHRGPVDRRSAPEVKVDFFAALFVARTDGYATRSFYARTGKAGWLPAVRGGWRKDIHCLRQERPEADDLKRA